MSDQTTKNTKIYSFLDNLEEGESTTISKIATRTGLTYRTVEKKIETLKIYRELNLDFTEKETEIVKKDKSAKKIQVIITKCRPMTTTFLLILERLDIIVNLLKKKRIR
jgi:DNA-binding transcriptional ArsR family regulator